MSFALLAVAFSVVAGAAFADLSITLVDEARLPYELSPSNYDNSPSNYDNSVSNYDNSPSNYDNSESNYDNGPSEMHVHQAELNIELFHETTVHRPEDAIIVYGLAEDYGRLTLHRVERRPAIFIEALGKAAAAFDADSAAAVTAEGVVTRQCVICPYRSRCAAAQTHAIPAAGTGGLDQATLRSIDRLIVARQRAVEAEEEAVRARAETEAEIIETLTNGGASKIKRNGYAVQLKRPADGLAVLEIRSA